MSLTSSEVYVIQGCVCVRLSVCNGVCVCVCVEGECMKSGGECQGGYGVCLCLSVDLSFYI